MLGSIKFTSRKSSIENGYDQLFIRIHIQIVQSKMWFFFGFLKLLSSRKGFPSVFLTTYTTIWEINIRYVQSCVISYKRMLI